MSYIVKVNEWMFKEQKLHELLGAIYNERACHTLNFYQFSTLRYVTPPK